MRKTLVLTAAAILGFAAAPAMAATGQRTSQPEASIPFINHGGIYNWRATSDDTIYFEDNFRHWYKATLMTPSIDLPFVWHIGVRNRATDTLDRWATVYVKGQPYQIQSFVKVAGPPPAHKHTVN